MKNFFFLLALNISIHSYGQSSASVVVENKPTIQCQYLLTYKPDSTSTDTKESIFTLFASKDFSFFKDKTALKHDSLLSLYSGVTFDQQNAKIFSLQLRKMQFPAFTYSIYKSRALAEIIYFDRIGSNYYNYTEPANIFLWHIKPQKASIAGYVCQKATASFAGRIWEAWFTNEIPISDGPYKFCGLPGLIIKVADTHNYYVFELLNLFKITNPKAILIPSKNVTKTTKKSFYLGKNNYAVNTLDRMTARGNNFTEDTKRAYQERAKKRNNSLELK